MLKILSARKIVSFVPFLVLALVLVLAGCGSSTQSKSGTSNSGSHATSHQGAANDKQSSDDQGSADSQSGSPKQLAMSELLDKGKTYSYTFKNEGDYTIICQIHPSMTMDIQVKADGAKGKKTIDIKDFNFTPGKVTVAPGTTVTWINDDTTQHLVVVQQ